MFDYIYLGVLKIHIDNMYETTTSPFLRFTKLCHNLRIMIEDAFNSELCWELKQKIQ